MVPQVRAAAVFLDLVTMKSLVALAVEFESCFFVFLFRSVCQEYFLDGGMRRMIEKDAKSAMLTTSLTTESVSAQPYSTIPR